MSFWKKFGYTVASCAIAGPIGGAVVSYVSHSADKKNKNLQDELNKSKAQNQRDMAENVNLREQNNEFYRKNKILEKNLEEALKKIKDSDSFFNSIIALFAVGIATANCDGHISNEELADIHDFISIISTENYPSYVNDRIVKIYQAPLNIKEAFSLAINSALHINYFDELIQVVVHSDEFLHEKESIFIEAWGRLKNEQGALM